MSSGPVSRGVQAPREIPADLSAILPELSPIDIFRGVIPLQFGGKRFELAALSIEEDEAWMASLDGSLRQLLAGVQSGEDDAAAIVAVLFTANDKLLDAIYAYDKGGVLLPREGIKALARAVDVLRAALTIWVATNPTLAAGIALQAATAKASPTTGASPSPTNSRPNGTAGKRTRSAGA